MSKREAANLDPGNFKPAFVYTIYIEASPEKLWQALTTAEFTGSTVPANRSKSIRGLAAPYHAHAGRRRAHRGRGDRVDPPRKLTVTFNVNWPALVEKLGPTLVTFDLEPRGTWSS